MAKRTRKTGNAERCTKPRSKQSYSKKKKYCDKKRYNTSTKYNRKSTHSQYNIGHLKVLFL